MTAPTTPQAQVSEKQLLEILSRHLGVETAWDVPIPVAAILSAMREATALSAPPARDDVAALVEALEPFVVFLGFVEAGRELDGDPAAEDTMPISCFSGNGASAMITMGDLRRAAQSLARVRGGGK